ncbi:MAG: RNA methyltransferase [Fulvimarina manganoxydans]|uniref:TrmH family RNA methyltransferase n=1 Tax=Fulvimarina manganoxydans TaxID=937218 RepID=UPI0023564BC7|nr:RNA methyltransferase [Fulvimarina manganoxydans]MCK5932823.1 RNA methyltransferase [Fulvimarina manganoxydans]
MTDSQSLSALLPGRTILPITDPNDPRIAVFRDIREKDLVRRSGFIAEGTVLLDQLAISERFRADSLLVLKNRLPGTADRIQRLGSDCPVHVAEREVIDAIAGFPMHRGVLAFGTEREAAPTLETVVAKAAAQAKKPILAAIGIANHDNVGALFRNAAAFGVGAVLLDETSCHPLYRKALRVSVGTVLTTPWHHGGDAETILKSVCEAGYQPVALTPSAEATPASLDPARPLALFVGAEGPGLPASVLGRAMGLGIPMAEHVDSLNVAVSAAIVLARLFEARKAG